MIISEALQGVILPRTVVREIPIPIELQEEFSVGEEFSAPIQVKDGAVMIVIPERAEIPLPPSFSSARVISLQVIERDGLKTLREVPAQAIAEPRTLSEEFLRSLREVMLEPGKNEVALPSADSFEQLRDFLELVADKLTVLPEKSSKQLEETLRIIASLRKNSIFSVSLRDALEVNIQKLEESKSSESSGTLLTTVSQVDQLTEGLRETISEVKKVSDGLQKLQLSSPQNLPLNRVSTAIQESIQKAVTELEELTERVERLPERLRIVLLKTLINAPEAPEAHPQHPPREGRAVEISNAAERLSKESESAPDALPSEVQRPITDKSSDSDQGKIRSLRNLPPTTVRANEVLVKEIAEPRLLKVVELALLQLKNLQRGPLREPLVKELELQIQKLPIQLRPERGVSSPVTSAMVELIRKPRGEIPVEVRPAIQALSLTRSVNFNPERMKDEQRVLELVQKQEQLLPKALSKMLVAVQKEIRAILQNKQIEHPVRETVQAHSEPMQAHSELLQVSNEVLPKAKVLPQREALPATSRIPAAAAQERRPFDTSSKNSAPREALPNENEQSEIVFAERFSKSLEKSVSGSSFEKVTRDHSQKLEERDTLSFLRASISGSDADLVKRLLTRLDDVRTERLRDLVQQLSKEFEVPPPIEKIDESLFRLEQELLVLPKGVETPRTLRSLSTLTNALGVMLAAPDEEFHIKPPPWSLLLALQQSVEDTATVLTTAERVQTLVNSVFDQGEKVLTPSAGFTTNEKALRLRELVDGLYSSLQKEFPPLQLRGGESFSWREFLKPKDELVLQGLQKELRGVVSAEDTLQSVRKLKGEAEGTAPELTKILQMMKPTGEGPSEGVAALSDARSLIDEFLSAKEELPVAVKEQYLRLRERVDGVLAELRPSVSRVTERRSGSEALPDESSAQNARGERPSIEQSSERIIKRRELAQTVQEEWRMDEPTERQVRTEREISPPSGQSERAPLPLTVPTTEATALLHRIDSFIRTQETLNSLNGVMHSMGEAAFILFPSVVNGLLTKFELSYAASEHVRPGRHPEEYELSGEREQPSRGRVRKSHRVRFKIQLAALGEVEVDFVHELNGARIKLRTAEGEVTEFLNGELPALGNSLQEIGIRPVEVRAEQGELNDVRPEWIRALLGTNGGLRR